jgi:hypothetical protein
MLCHIYGNTPEIDTFEADIESLVQRRVHALGSRFKTFHANKIGANGSVAEAAEEIFDIFKQYIIDKRIKCLIVFQSNTKRENNTKFLQKIIKEILSSQCISMQFPNLQQTDHPALYNRIDQSWGVINFREELCEETETIFFVPDSSGKILHYEKNKQDVVDLRNNTTFQWDFYKLVQVLLNSVIKCVKDPPHPGFPKTDRYIEKYQPLSDVDSRAIQVCDVISNYIFHALKVRAGIGNNVSTYKNNIIEDKLGIKDSIDELFKQFDNNLIFTNDLDYGVIRIYPEA